MSTRKELGKISLAYFGMGGYQDAMIGIHFTLGGKSWGVCDFWGWWASPADKYTKWSAQDQLNYHGETTMRIAELLQTAKVHSVQDLQGIAVEAEFEGNTLREWRVLEEVL